MSERSVLRSAPARIAAFVAGLVVVFVAALGVGAAADPDTEPAAEPMSGHGETTGVDSAGPDGGEPSGLLHLSLSERTVAPGNTTVSFQVQDAAGDPVTSYDVEHEKELHLVVLGTANLTDFQHVHPTRAADGTWTARLRLAPGAAYRLYADGSTAGAGFLATADLVTTGRNAGPGPIPAPGSRDHVDGFTVDLDQADGDATLSVIRAGKPATLEPYLGALGHLVVIRVDDLEYLHVHPEVGATPVFAVSGLAPGRYRYFFDFQVDGVVRTAAFTVNVGDDMVPAPTETETETEKEEDSDEHGH
jgi:hypothetical protein